LREGSDRSFRREPIAHSEKVGLGERKAKPKNLTVRFLGEALLNQNFSRKEQAMLRGVSKRYAGNFV